MDRYNKLRAPKRIVARFCRCGKAAIASADNEFEIIHFVSEWEDVHRGSSHGEVDFDEWLDRAMKPVLALAS